jgi:nitrate reductase gamma subunit
MMAIVCGVLLILRRVFTPYVRAVSSWRDYAVMTLVLVPFVTGLLAREFAGQYEFIMIIHLAGAHMLLVAIGWSRLGHFIFFTTGRIFFSASSGGVR